MAVLFHIPFICLFEHVECTGGAHRYVDEKILGFGHMYQYPTCQEYYATGSYDPEGILGSLTCAVLCFFGITMGRILRLYSTPKQRIGRWLLYSVIFGLTAGGLCENGGFIPVNKNLWSISFILCQASTGTIVFILFYLIIDVFKRWDGKPFHWLGMNSIIVYCGSEILGSSFPFAWKSGITTHAKLLSSNVIGCLMWTWVAYTLYSKKIFFNL
ncbi:transmembrane protein [Reticulomyxa filosa]|uniref:Transmembrane protein n=1 Tax=Reticulomyxa filosa TaxID=46433 RepID=X6MGZ5_RETFI|nr:transmembrane protein [Reticulomyxa filosa]|eukprot:ETO13169.1 transmembrane protein [Reticulomyxa filosa]